MPYKFVVFKDKKDEYRFRLVASNGEIVAQSEGYTAKASCTDTIDAIKQNVNESTPVEFEE